MIDLGKELSGTYQITLQQADSLEVLLQPSPQWSYFVGHFPQMPVLPGVAIVEISQHLVEQLLGSTTVTLKRLPSFRIRQPIQPGDQIKVRVLRSEQKPEQPSSFNVLWKTAEADEKLLAELNLQVSEY